MKSIFFSNKILNLGVIPFLTLTLVNCNQPKDESSAFNMEQAKTEIASQIKAYENAMANGDVVGLSNLYTEDAQVLNSGRPSTIGRENISKVFEGWVRDSVISSFTTTGLWGNKDLLVEQGTGYFADSKGTWKSTGRYLLVWKNVDGEWKIFRDTWFADPKTEE